MKTQIVKIVYIDGTESEVKEFSPLLINTEESPRDKNIKERIWKRQFRDLEEEILDNLNEDTVESFAADHLSMIGEYDHECESTHLDECCDEELLNELKSRRLLPINNIITEDFLERFIKIAEKENSILLDNLLTEFEQKLNL